jgi:hypothetical protein
MGRLICELLPLLESYQLSCHAGTRGKRRRWRVKTADEVTTADCVQSYLPAALLGRTAARFSLRLRPRGEAAAEAGRESRGRIRGDLSSIFKLLFSSRLLLQYSTEGIHREVVPTAAPPPLRLVAGSGTTLGFRVV